MTQKDNYLLMILSGIAAVLLIAALAPLHYGYYTFLKIVVFGSALTYSILYYRSPYLKTIYFVIIFAMIAILFNPILLIPLPKYIWLYCDIICAIIFLSNIFFIKKRLHSST